MAEQPDKEEQYLLRVQDKDLAEKLSKILRQPASTTPPSLELKFTTQEGADPEARTGVLVVGGEAYPVKRQDLPTVVECFKTYDDTNLIKSADVGQVIVVPERGTELPDGIEARNGVTPPMRNARKRRFRKLRDINPAFMRQVEEAVLLIASGQAPEGYEFIDEEEEYMVSEDGRSGSWQPYQPGRFNPVQGDGQQKKGTKRKSKKNGEAEASEAAPSQEADAMDVETF